MSIYTVHEPPDAGGEPTDPHRFVFVRDGFSWPAFVLAPVWMLWHRLWLALAGYLVLIVVVRGVSVGLDFSSSATTAVALLVALLIGIEAATLRRWTLARRGWAMVGTVAAEDTEIAEQRFFDAWVEQRGKPAPQRPAPAVPPAATAGHGMPARNATTAGVVGLFPEPDVRQ